MMISTVGQLAVPAKLVDLDTTYGEIGVLLSADSHLPLVVVVDGRRVGVFTRDSHHRLLSNDTVSAASTPRDPAVHAAIDWRPARLPAATPMTAAFRFAHGRPTEHRYDDLLVDAPSGLATVTAARLFDIAAEGFAHQAEHDDLTGATARAPFITWLTAACADANAGGERVVLSVIDLDRLRSINEAFGHAVGDAVLAAAAARLSAAVGPGEFLARIGGDEFAVSSRAMHDAPATVIGEAIGDRWRQAVDTTDPSLGPGTYTSASVGVAVTGATADTRALLSAADRAVYEAKHLGGNRVVARSGVEARYTTSVPTADGGQARMLYRPVARVSGGRVDTIVAEPRWPPELIGRAVAGRLAAGPGDGAVPATDRWSLHTACADLLWFGDRLGSLAPDSVNVILSPAALTAAVDDAVLDALADTNLPPHRLRLQVPANSDLDVLTSAAPRLSRLRRYGVGLALDAVGTGPSCLHSLSIVQTNRMRLDPALIAGMVGNPRDHDVVHMLIVLARGLGVEVTATGVETEDEYAAVVGLGVDFVEGAYVAVARERTALAELLATGHQPYAWPA